MFDLLVFVPINDYYPLNQRQYLVEMSQLLFQQYNDINATLRGNIYARKDTLIKRAWFYEKVHNHKHDLHISTQLASSYCLGKQHELSKTYESYPEPLIRCMSSQKKL